MNDYIIITDSTGDFTPALCEELGIQVIPMEFMLDDVSYRNYPDERDLSGKEFYDKLRTGSNATTAQVNMATYCDVARPYLQAGKDVLFLVFSSGLSGSYNSCTLAVEDLKAEFADREIVAVDTRAASMGEGLLVYYAAQQQKAGKTLAEVADWVTETAAICATGLLWMICTFCTAAVVSPLPALWSALCFPSSRYCM